MTIDFTKNKNKNIRLYRKLYNIIRKAFINIIKQANEFKKVEKSYIINNETPGYLHDRIQEYITILNRHD